MNTIYLLLGSNMGNSRQRLLQAQGHITKRIGNIMRCSGIYLTAAWGNTQQPDFLNQVIIVGSELDATQTMDTILSIEKKMGRVRGKKNAPRIIDIDILFFNKAVIDKKHLQVPHPRIPNRRFVLIPLNELSPNLLHPVLKRTVHQLLSDCTDELDVKKF